MSCFVLEMWCFVFEGLFVVLFRCTTMTHRFRSAAQPLPPTLRLPDEMIEAVTQEREATQAQGEEGGGEQEGAVFL